MNIPHPHHLSRTWSKPVSEGAWRQIWKDPFVDWLIIVIVSAVLIAAFSAVGVVTYEGMKSALANQPGYTVPTSLADTRALNAVLSGFDARAAERESLRGGYGGAGDPSL